MTVNWFIFYTRAIHEQMVCKGQLNLTIIGMGMREH